MAKEKFMPLSQIKILDLTRLLPFGYGSMLLADMGAEVIKIEERAKGDYMRWIPPINKKESYAFLSTNRNKKSITLDLKKKKGKEVFFRLAKGADVIFESFRPGVVKKLGIDYKSIKKINPQMIYCSCTGYGQTGPYKNRVGHDINYMGVSGVLGVTGRQTGSPIVPGVPVADMTSGVFCALAISAALAGRQNFKEGRYIDVSMTDCMVSYMHIHSATLFGASKETLPISGGNVRYDSFETKDGKFITLGNVEDKFWLNFCDLIGSDDLKPCRFGNMKKQKGYMKEMRGIIRTKTRKEWLNFMEGKEICYGPVNEIDEVFEDPQAKYRGMYFEIEHPVEGKLGQISFPIKFLKHSKSFRSPPPMLGEHTVKILIEIGYSKKEIEQLRKQSVI